MHTNWQFVETAYDVYKGAVTAFLTPSHQARELTSTRSWRVGLNPRDALGSREDPVYPSSLAAWVLTGRF